MNLSQLSLLPLVFSVASCYKNPTCQVYKKRFYNKEVNIIVLDKGRTGNNFIVNGLNPTTGEKEIYTDVDGIYNYVYNNLEVGDTITKTTHDATFIIRKKKANILIAYNCLDGTYRGGSILDTLPKLTYGQMIVSTIPKSSLR